MERVPIKYLTTDGAARGAEGMLEGMRKHNERSELHRKADPVHIGQSQIREVMKTTFSDQLFPGEKYRKSSKKRQLWESC